MKINVFVTQISSERLWGLETPFPPQVQISLNVNILGLERKGESLLDAPFIFSVNFTPSIAQISIKGNGHLAGEKVEIDNVFAEYDKNKTPPPQLVQAISSMAMADSILVSKILGVPPPLPPISPPPSQQKAEFKPKYTM
ncbi:MAG: hypothetical protein QW390_04675 [Candidatus Bathyarchaeia archaeon]